IQMPGKRNGTLGSAVINGRATDVLDSHFYINQATGNWLDANGNSDTSHDGEKPKTLLVDDSAFFRSLISPLLSVEGWEVTAVSSAKDALALRDSGATFELIISDIDMPEIDGFDFAANIRSDDRWSNTPLIALSARTSEKNIDRAHQLGFTDYVAKRDREGLIRSIRSIIGKAAA
ncbi:MAG: response regulator, partial [Alphaproteobacteria bacterium]|nr:response regulator [Alphaproteobacteria bacterium]